MRRLRGAPEDMDERQRAVHDKIASGPRGRVAGPLALWLHSPDLAERAQALGEHLRFNTAFPKRLSEMVILMVAARHRCEFEWFVHAPIAEREGLPAETIDAIREGRQPEGLVGAAGALYRAAAGLLRSDRLSDREYSEFMAGFGPVGLVELTALIGYYQIGAHLLNAVEHDTADGSRVFGRGSSAEPDSSPR